MKIRITLALTMGALAALLVPLTALAQGCPGRPSALGTARVMEVPAGVRVGTKSFPQTLALKPKEVVLTFDDGPWPKTTAAVLDALKAQCVRAT
ncbi:MAG: polysaccharide deacetylase, partial [Rhizobiales bacterium 39-66-18]